MIALLLAVMLAVAPTTAEAEFVDGLNRERCAVGHAPLVWDGRLGVAADLKAQEMEQYGYFAHRSPVSGLWPNDLVRASGYRYAPAFRPGRNNVESIFAGVPERDGLARLLASPSHRPHLIGDGGFAKYRDIGVGISGPYLVVLTAYKTGRLPARPTCKTLGY